MELLALAVAITGLCVSCLTLGGALMALGAERQKLSDLERRHGENTTEFRNAIAELRGRLGSIEVKGERSATLIEASSRGRAP